VSGTQVRPLVILAGFLGAGKTSFLRTLVAQLVQRDLRPRIILNDLENARIDAATLRDLEAELTPITGGCLCCETQDELVETLRAEAASPYDVVLLETNGTTDTGALLEILSETKGLDHLASPLQLTIIDAVKFGRRGWINAIEKEQLRTSSHVRVGKKDLVESARYEEVVSAVQALAPAARFAEAAELAEAIVEQLTEAHAPVAPPRSRTEGRADADRVDAVIGKGRRVHARHTLISCQVKIPFPIDPSSLEAFLGNLPEQVLRAKGIMLLRDPLGEKRSFQWVSGHGGEVSPCHLQDPETLAPVAIFVGSGLDVAALRDGLMALR
jgi:G3E family GTPase